jgi:hypothetical protein
MWYCTELAEVNRRNRRKQAEAEQQWTTQQVGAAAISRFGHAVKRLGYLDGSRPGRTPQAHAEKTTVEDKLDVFARRRFKLGQAASRAPQAAAAPAPVPAAPAPPPAAGAAAPVPPKVPSVAALLDGLEGLDDLDTSALPGARLHRHARHYALR